MQEPKFEMVTFFIFAFSSKGRNFNPRRRRRTQAGAGAAGTFLSTKPARLTRVRSREIASVDAVHRNVSGRSPSLVEADPAVKAVLRGRVLQGGRKNVIKKPDMPRADDLILCVS